MEDISLVETRSSLDALLYVGFTDSVSSSVAAPNLRCLLAGGAADLDEDIEPIGHSFV